MLFYSNIFIAFFLLFLPFFCLTKGIIRLALVFIASGIFYAWWCPAYIFLLMGFVFFSYYSALYVSRMPRWQFIVTLGFIFAPLVFFKYSAFLMNNLSFLFGRRGDHHAAWALPLGISFITFTVAAYLMDIRKGLIVPERKFLRYGVFVSFFPHLIAGPIMRAKELLPQLDHLVFKKKFIKLGLYLYAIGMVKKVVFADQIGFFVDKFYNFNSSANVYNSLFALYGFAVQIYCDFSGYVDMAYGLAFIMGIRLPLNFNRPYGAISIRDFWRRWHMTLSRWLRDYLYIPLGGNRKGHSRMLINIMMTMILGGLWHGASWMFILWGTCHGTYLLLERLCSRFLPLVKVPAWLGTVLTFHLVTFAWLLFRSRDFGQLKHILGGFITPTAFMPFISLTLFPVILIVIAFIVHRWDRISLGIWAVRKLPGAVVVSGSLCLILLSKVFTIGGAKAFIYFNF